MGYVRQDVFSVGQVDDINFEETSSKLYLKALKSALNIFINDTGKAAKRTGLRNINILSDLAIGAKLTDNSRVFKFLAQDNEYYIVFATNLALDFYKVSTNSFVAPVVTPYTDAQLAALDFTNSENELILVHPLHIPARVTEAAGVFSYIAFNFAVQPAFDFNDVVYNGATATMTNGTTAEFTLTFSGAPVTTFTAEWEGGIVIGNGIDNSDPIGYGVIKTATALVLICKKKISMQDGVFLGQDFSVRKPVFTPALGFPQSVIFFQNRIWFANTKSLKNTVFGSQINKFDNFDVGVGRDTDAIIYTLGDSDAGQIIFLNAGKQIEIYTENIEYVAPQPSGIALTPSSFYITRQSSYGVSSVSKPVTYENDSYYIGRGGKNVFKFEFQGLGEAYASENISIASSNLIKTPSKRAILQSSSINQENFIFYLNSDDTITVYQFSDVAGINAFMPLVIGNQGNIEVIDIVTVNNLFYLLIKLTLTSKFILARFDTDFYHDLYVAKTLPANGVITGLDEYNGYTVSTVFEGQDFGNNLVAGGTITVSNPDMQTGPCTIGITYDVEITPLSLFIGGDTSDALKKSTYEYVDFFKSLNFNINGKLVPFQTFAEIQAGLPLTPKSGRARVGTAQGWKLGQNVVITQSSPLPLTILAISYQASGELI